MSMSFLLSLFFLSFFTQNKGKKVKTEKKTREKKKISNFTKWVDFFQMIVHHLSPEEYNSEPESRAS